MVTSLPKTSQIPRAKTKNYQKGNKHKGDGTDEIAGKKSSTANKEKDTNKQLQVLARVLYCRVPYVCMQHTRSSSAISTRKYIGTT